MLTPRGWQLKLINREQKCFQVVPASVRLTRQSWKTLDAAPRTAALPAQKRVGGCLNPSRSSSPLASRTSRSLPAAKLCGAAGNRSETSLKVPRTPPAPQRVPISLEHGKQLGKAA